MSKIKRRPEDLSLARLKEVVSYDPQSGEFIRLIGGGRKRAGDVAGYNNSEGYKLIWIDGHWWLGHRLAIYWTTGALPLAEVDHINGDPSDNRIANLRECTRSQNMANTRARGKYKGVHWHSTIYKWQAMIRVNGKKRFLGAFDNEEDARDAYQRAAKEAFGEFAFIEPAPKPVQEALL